MIIYFVIQKRYAGLALRFLHTCKYIQFVYVMCIIWTPAHKLLHKWSVRLCSCVFVFKFYWTAKQFSPLFILYIYYIIACCPSFHIHQYVHCAHWDSFCALLSISTLDFYASFATIRNVHIHFVKLKFDYYKFRYDKIQKQLIFIK